MAANEPFRCDPPLVDNSPGISPRIDPRKLFKALGAEPVGQAEGLDPLALRGALRLAAGSSSSDSAAGQAAPPAEARTEAAMPAPAEDSKRQDGASGIPTHRKMKP